MWAFDENGSPLTPISYSFVLISSLFSFYKSTPDINKFSFKFRNFSLNSLVLPSPKSSSNMGVRLPSILLNTKKILTMQSISSRCRSNVPKGHIAVYVGELQRKRFVVPISYLNHPSFVRLLNRAEEEFGFKHPTGGLTIPCREDAFIDLTSRLHSSWKKEQKLQCHTKPKDSRKFSPTSLFIFVRRESK